MFICTVCVHVFLTELSREPPGRPHEAPKRPRAVTERSQESADCLQEFQEVPHGASDCAKGALQRPQEAPELSTARFELPGSTSCIERHTRTLHVYMHLLMICTLSPLIVRGGVAIIRGGGSL
jgi:hypothetical protein